MVPEVDPDEVRGRYGEEDGRAGRQARGAGAFQRACAEQGLRISRYFGNSPKLRMVTHNDVTRADVDAALGVVAAVLAPARSKVATPAD